MSRSGYYEDCEDPLAHGRWRAQVMSAIRGKRGQAVLRDILAGLDALPEKRLISNSLIVDGNPAEDELIVGADQLVTEDGGVVRVGDVCALGAAGLHRGLSMGEIDPEQPEWVAATFDIAEQLAREIAYINDEASYRAETPEQRFTRVRAWVVSNLLEKPSDLLASPGEAG